MGTRGPVPKRSEDRIRRNLDDPVEKVAVFGTVEVPELNMPDAHPIVIELYESMKDSAQAKFYEPSDWVHAKVVCHFLDAQVKSSKPSGQMMATIFAQFTDMLLTEGARRRVKLEIEREQGQAQVIDLAKAFEQRFSA